MNIREAEAGDLEGWIALRHALWPHHDVASLTPEAKAILDSRHEVCLVAVTDTSQIVGFIEGAIYEAPGGPYAHVEDWFVRGGYASRVPSSASRRTPSANAPAFIGACTGRLSG